MNNYRNMSETVVDVVKALLSAQKKITVAVKGSDNPYFNSKYADLLAVIDACKDALNENGIVALQPHRVVDGDSYVETLLLHTSGQWISGLTKIESAKPNNPQAFGSAITYARR